MFYSQSLLSKGQLRNIWVAAYFFKKLRKEQITSTDISSTIDQILPDGKISYRILAQLLLGIVRIFSKKVEFLYQDCHETLIKIGKFSIASLPRNTHYSPTRKRRKLAAIQAPSSVSLVEVEVDCESFSGTAVTVPKRFDLDSFDLQIEEETEHTESSDGNLSKDSQTDDGDRERFLIQHEQAEVARQDNYSAVCFTPFDDFLLPPDLMDLDLELDPKDDHLREYSHHLEESETHESIGARRSLDTAVSMNREILEEDRECLFENSNKSPTDDLSIQIEPEVAHKMAYHEKCLANEVMLPEDTTALQGLAAPKIAVTTPSKREQPWTMKKRKRNFMDEKIVLSNKLLKTWIHDSSNLICKRRKAPATHLDSWRTSVISKLSQSLMDPLITCISPELKVLFRMSISNCWRNESPEKPVNQTAESERSVRVSIPPQVVNCCAVEPPADEIAESERRVNVFTPPHIINSYAAEKPADQISETERSVDVSTPPQVVYSRLGCVGVEGKSGELSPERSSNYELFLQEVGSYDAANEIDAGGVFSVRTRSVMRILSGEFMRLRDDQEPMSFDRILNGCSRRRSAMFFYETLTLKTIGYIDVSQKSPYGDIIIHALPPLEHLSPSTNKTMLSL